MSNYLLLCSTFKFIYIFNPASCIQTEAEHRIIPRNGKSNILQFNNELDSSLFENHYVKFPFGIISRLASCEIYKSLILYIIPIFESLYFFEISWCEEKFSYELNLLKRFDISSTIINSIKMFSPYTMDLPLGYLRSEGNNELGFRILLLDTESNIKVFYGSLL